MFRFATLSALYGLALVPLIAWLLFRAGQGHFGRQYYTPVDLGGLYWHIVDVIWIFLFPLFYLV